MFMHLIEKLNDELKEMDKKVASGQDLGSDEYECLDVLAHALKSLTTVKAMEEAEYDGGYSGRGYSREGEMSRMNSYGNGSRMYYPMRSMRYSRNDGNDAIMRLQTAYDNAQSEQERKIIRKLIEDME